MSPCLVAEWEGPGLGERGWGDWWGQVRGSGGAGAGTHRLLLQGAVGRSA